MYQHKQYAVFIFVVLAWISGFVALAWNLMGADVPLMVFAGILLLVGFLFHGLTIKVDEAHITTKSATPCSVDLASVGSILSDLSEFSLNNALAGVLLEVLDHAQSPL